MKRATTLLFSLLLLALTTHAQRHTYDFRQAPLAEVLERLNNEQNDYTITFIHNDLEHLTVTARLKGLDTREAVEKICAGLPVKVKTKGKDIFVQYQPPKSRRTLTLTGKVYDSRTHNELPGAMVYLLSKDSIVLDSCLAKSFCQQDDKKWYQADFHFSIPQTQDTYLFETHMAGYETGHMEYTISHLHRREFSRQMPPIYLLEAGRMLKEVVVTASKVKFYHRGDTVVYDASAFQLAEGSMLDALVKQLPGVELKSDGQILHNGKFVESLLLNGKDFFKGDNRVMLDNLPAYTVKNVEFYDKYGEKSEFLGQKLEGDKAYVMDVKLKKEYSIGYLANLEAGGGTNERYLGRLFAMRFTDHSRLAIFANANNLNDDTRPGEDDNWYRNDETGRTTQQQGGLDYSVDARNKKWNLQGNARFSHAEQDMQSSTHRTNFLPTGDTYERSRSLADNRSFRLNTWNQFRYTFPKVQLTLTPNLTYTHTDNRSQFLSSAFTDADSLINSNRQQGILRGHELHAAFTAKATIKMEHSNDYYELETNMNYRQKDDDRFNRQQVTYAATALQEGTPEGTQQFPHTLFADQYFKNHPDRYQNIWAQAMYHRAIKQNMSLDASINYEHRDTRREQSLYLLDRLDTPHDSIGVLPSVAEYERTMDKTNSYNSHLAEDYYSVNPILWWFPKTRGGKWSISLRLPMSVRNQHLRYQRGSVDTTIVRRPLLVSSEWNYAQWRSNDGKYTVFIQPQIATSAPALQHFVDIRDATDPLNIHLGNSHLRQTHRYNLRVMTAKRIPEKQVFETIGAEYQYVQNQLAMSHLFNPSTGVHTYQPFNVDGNWRFRTDVGIQAPLDKPKRLLMDMGTSFSLIHSVD